MPNWCLRLHQAFQNLMHLHILFSASASQDSNGTLLPTARLPLSLDDEAQCRCASFMQTEVERFAEELESTSSADSPRREDEVTGSENERSHDENPSKLNGTHRSKQSTNDCESTIYHHDLMG